ncbi:unnamed protein product [Adineta ricciae]|uniref:Uncharacterized protein n=1 Tax=Adineta ricciae TaxID=249248 RepID=A0A815DKP1_ADIRI|nr:unnamed protein product [Adineta ricciae]
MVSILLGSDDKIVKCSDVSKTLIRLLYGVHDLGVALVRFDTSYSSQVIGMDDMLAEFDGHIGDCGCQLRAQMLWNITEHYREAKSREWIANIVQTLEHIKNRIITMYCDIRRLKTNKQSLGFPPSIQLADIFERIGCKSLFTILDNHSSKTVLDDELTILTNFNHDITYHSNNTGGKPSGTRLNKRERRRTSNVDKWHLSDYRMIARFLSYCRILSLNKTAILEPGATRIRSRLDPLFAASMTEKQLDNLNLIDEDVLSSFICNDDRPTRTGLIREIENMQVYVSQLTCDWLTKLSLEMGLTHPIQKLLSSSVQISSRLLHCTSAYASILVIRIEWLVKHTPLFLVVRRFCTHGYHNIFYRVSINSEAVRSKIESIRQNNSKIVEFGNADWFHLTFVPLESILHQEWAKQPHVILISNSINGNMDDFYLRMGNTNHCGPHNSSCLEYEDFVTNEFGKINFSQAIMYFFGAHDQYPFELTVNETEFDVIEKIVHSTLGREAAMIYRQTVDEAQCYRGQYTALGLLNFQHIFTELPIIVARQTEYIALKNERPSLYGYRRTEIVDVNTIRL